MISDKKNIFYLGIHLTSFYLKVESFFNHKEEGLTARDLLDHLDYGVGSRKLPRTHVSKPWQWSFSKDISGRSFRPNISPFWKTHGATNPSESSHPFFPPHTCKCEVSQSSLWPFWVLSEQPDPTLHIRHLWSAPQPVMINLKYKNVRK